MQMHRQSLTAYGAPLCETVVDAPQPKGTEVLVRIARCGVCHSDLHMQDGYFLLGDGKQLDVRGGRTLPFTLGHEIAGQVESAGPEANVALGQPVAIYPWIGCGACAACKVGDENICAAPRHLGITVDGGFATHVLIPHPRYLIDYAPLSPSYAGALMCSGLTAYAALKRLADRAARAPLLLVGLGGVGLMGLALARAMYGTRALRRRHRPAQTRGRARRRRAGRLRSGRCGRAQGAAESERRHLRGLRFRRLRQVVQFRHRRAGQGRQGGGHRPDRRRLFHRGRHVPAQGHDHRGHHHRHAWRKRAN